MGWLQRSEVSGVLQVRGARELPREVKIRFWELVRAGLPAKPATQLLGISHTTGSRWFGEAGGVMSNAPRPLSDRFLSLAEREEIMVLRAQGESQAEIGRILKRSAGTISRELTRNTVAGQEYRASVAQAAAAQRAKRGEGRQTRRRRSSAGPGAGRVAAEMVSPAGQ